MNELQLKIRQAQRRLWLNRWLGKVGWCLSGAAVAFAAFVIFERMAWVLQEEGYVLWRVLGGLTGTALLASLVWTYATRDSLAVAAARLDEAARLKERLSTALHFAGSADPFAQAAVADAQHVSRLVTPRVYLPVRMPRSASWAGASFVVALMFFWLFPVVDLSGKQEARQEEQVKKEQLERAKVQVKPVADKLKEMEKRHPELKKQAEEADPLALAKLDSPADLKKNALKQINAAAAKLEEKKSQADLAKVDDFKQMLRNVAASPTPTSNVSMLSKALAKGDFKAAQQSLNSLRQQLSNVPETPEEKAQADQVRSDLKKLADQVGKIAESDNKLMDKMRQMNLSEQDIKQMMDSASEGKMSELEKKLAEKGLSQDQINSLMKQAAGSEAAKKEASKLAQSLAKAAQKGQNGQQGKQGQGGQKGQGQQGENGQGGQGGQQGQGDEGFTQAGEQLSEMESLQQELAELSSSLSDLQDMKDSMGGNMGQGFGQDGDPNRRGPGMGQLGQGQGGVAPEQETAFNLSPERSKVHTTSGAIIDQRFVEGEQYKGEVKDDFVEAVLGAREDLTDVTRRKTQPRHIKLRQAEYFKHVEADLPKEKVEAAKEKLEAQSEEAK